MLYIINVFQMTSKLETYCEVILPALAQGRSYRAVANDLLHLGVEVSAQSIWSWHTRRMRRIERRRLKFSGTPVPGGPCRIQPTGQSALPASNPAATEPASETLQTLRSRIDEQARQQEINPWTGLTNRFPVSR